MILNLDIRSKVEERFEFLFCRCPLKSEKDLWYLNSGCLRHISGNTSLFTKINKKGHRSVTFGDKGRGKIIDIGKIGKDPSNSVDNVYLVGGLNFNLLHISQLCDKGNLLKFDSIHCMVKNKQSKKILFVVLELKMYTQLILIVCHHTIYHVLKHLIMRIIGYDIKN